jgi:hypothetical protein
MRNTGKRPHEKLLEIMNVGTTLTPAEINAHVGNGDYASKHVWFLGKLGFTFDIVKDGRTVTSYTMTAEPANAAEIRNPAPKAAKVKAPKVAKAPKAKAAKTVKVAAPKTEKTTKTKVRVSKQTPIKKAARDILKDKADAQADALLAELGMRNGGEVRGGSYSVDPDWDALDGIDPMALINHEV